MRRLDYGTQVTTADGIVGYVLGYQDAPEGASHNTDMRVFRFDSNGEECENIGVPEAWEPTGLMADPVIVASMKVWQADQDFLDVLGSYDVCQKCGGRPGMVDDMYRCLCSD